MHVPRHLPALFHRVFLSHLLVLAISFVTALILFDYLFVEGIAHFLVHTPIILIPVLLALIGLVGLLALWTAGAVALALDRTATALDDIDPPTALERLLPEARIEEVARIVAVLRRKTGHDGMLHPLFLRCDVHLNVCDADVDTAARLGHTPEQLRRQNLRTLLVTADDAARLRDAARALRADRATHAPTRDAARELVLHFRGAAARILPVRCLLYLLPGDETLLIGIPGKVA